jgi:hypothetical protein
MAQADAARWKLRDGAPPSAAAARAGEDMGTLLEGRAGAGDGPADHLWFVAVAGSVHRRRGRDFSAGGIADRASQDSSLITTFT